MLALLHYSCFWWSACRLMRSRKFRVPPRDTLAPVSPAANSGLQKGDQIIKLANDQVQDVEKFQQAVAARKPGEKLALEILRNGKELKLEVTVGNQAAQRTFKFPDFPGARTPGFLGVQTQDLTPELKNRLKIDSSAGAVVTEVIPNSAAAKAGMRNDDVITAVGGQPVKNSAELREAIQKIDADQPVTLEVARGKEKLNLQATLQRGTFGFFPGPSGERRFPTMAFDPALDQGQRIRELERRVEALEKSLRELEKKQAPRQP
jgi:S1-C subfamily serine protease